jgi:hypothetical protein
MYDLLQANWIDWLVWLRDWFIGAKDLFLGFDPVEWMIQLLGLNVSRQYLIDYARTLIYPSLAASWLAASMLAILYYFQEHKETVTWAAGLLFFVVSSGYALLSLMTGLDPLLDSATMLPWLIFLRGVQQAVIWWLLLLLGWRLFHRGR